MMRFGWSTLLFTICLAASPGFAQTGAPLLLTPWQTLGASDSPDGSGARYELHTGGLYLDDTSLDESGEEVSFFEFESRGRMKLTDAPGPGPAVGFNVLHYDLSTNSPALPDRLTDVSVAAAFGIPMADSAWEVGFVAGVGYAGTRPFSDADAIYLMGDVIFKRDLDAASSITFVVNYDGNRSVLPDVPLPGGYYSRRVSDSFAYTVGLPYSSVRWSPADRWTVSAQGSVFALPFIADVTVSYALADTLDVYGSFNSRRPAFWIEDEDNERLFFQQRRLEAGVRYQARDGITLLVAGGWAFDQEIEAGWDVRDLDNVRDLDDEPYVRVALDLAF